MNKKDVDIMSSLQKNYFSADYVFDYSQGLNFAFAFTAYDQVAEDILDPSYGEIAFSRYEWGMDSDGEYFVRIKEIPSHTCTKEELGLEGAANS